MDRTGSMADVKTDAEERSTTSSPSNRPFPALFAAAVDFDSTDPSASSTAR
jgi:hypothetical protein